ncbi:hypothetical protein LOK49_LG02G00366 [Camellia lanceoleosa]|uniref:Uncharacterized protein n=1 Tax=Camellia lanceoleosa TaxID=1840588 RepID=A0ACC0ISN7_9ERIC|nr:hypothetical protein LOK49_LG02G00366 [Camellia lanceoleosa]
MFEEKAQRISEAAIALKDEAGNAWDNVNSTRNTIQEIVNEETVAQEAVQKATMALSLAEARLQVAVDSLEAAKGRKSDLEYESGGEESNILRKDGEAVLMGLSSHQQSLFHGLIESARKQLPKLVIGSLLIGAGIAFYTNRVERINQLFLQPDIITAHHYRWYRRINEEEASLFDMSRLLFASVIYVPIFQKIPGDKFGMVHRGLAWFLQKDDIQNLSLERLSSMKKYVFGLGSAQVLVTAVVVGLVSRFIAAQPNPAAIIIGNGLHYLSLLLSFRYCRNEVRACHAMDELHFLFCFPVSSDAVQLYCAIIMCLKGEHFGTTYTCDLAVVVLLILTPLISPNSSTGAGGVGFQAIAEPLGLAAVKAIVAITAIIAGGRLLLRPIYKQVAENQNAEIFSANTLLVILGPSLLTARVESDIAPYCGLLLGLFFMMVGMSIDPKLVVSNFPVIMGTLPLLIGGKTILVAVAGRLFGISIISAIRVGLLLAPGGEFAFVAFGEAVNQIELDCFPSHGGLYQ